MTNEKIESEVNVKASGNGFIITVKDQYTNNTLALTREELESIILYGQLVLVSTPKPTGI